MSADNFANFLKEAQALGTVHLTKLLASNGVLSKSALKLLTDQQISLLGTRADRSPADIQLLRLWRDGKLTQTPRPSGSSGPLATTSTLHPQVRVATRSDLHIVRPVQQSKRCKLSRALEVTLSAESRTTALANLNSGMWAATTTGPQQSRWRTWCELAAAW